MNESSGHPNGQTLAACLLSLVPGEPCPLCGEPLSKLKSSGAGRQLTVLSECEPADGAVLICQRCGCEVAADEEPAKASGCRTFSVAA
jgi:hypothetical protein